MIVRSARVLLLVVDSCFSSPFSFVSCRSIIMSTTAAATTTTTTALVVPRFSRRLRGLLPAVQQQQQDEILSTTLSTQLLGRRRRDLATLLAAAAGNNQEEDGSSCNNDDDNNNNKKNSSTSAKKPRRKKSTHEDDKERPACLPRTREKALLKQAQQQQSIDNNNDNNKGVVQQYYVLGVDEAGRGPLAGPVVAAAVWCPVDLPGVVDSKKITSETARQAVYDQIVACPKVQWAVAVVDAPTIDDINILQATLLGMRLSLRALMENDNANAATATTAPTASNDKDDDDNHHQPLVRAEKASIDIPGTYVVTSANINAKKPLLPVNACYALIDGNRLPSHLPCAAETMVKGDGREYAIAAASVLAKVTRDALMHAYDAQYPAYGLAQHKGYPTAAHMAAVHQHGASPIHRRSFAPLKHMEFDDQGNIVGERKVETKKTTTSKKRTTKNSK